MKATAATMAEWVGPLCRIKLSKSMSMSGIIDNTNSSGTLRDTLRALATGLPSRYAKAMCPTASEWCASSRRYHLTGLGSFKVIGFDEILGSFSRSA